MLLRSAAVCAAGILLCAVSGRGQTIQSALNSASYTTSLAPGTWAAIFGTGLAPATVIASAVPFPMQLGSVSVTVAGLAAPLSYVSATQINALIPFEAASLTGAQTAAVPIVVTTPSGATKAFTIILTQTAPAIYTKNLSGSGAALAFDANFNPITTLGTAPIVLYATGLGPTNPPASTGSLGAGGTEPLNRVQDTVALSIGGSSATVLYAGLAPGLQGIYQLNIMPPASISLGNALTMAVGLYSAQVLTLPVSAGTNATNLTGTINGLYPATGPIATQQGGATSDPVSFSALLTAAAFTTSFDIVPGANPFQIVALGISGAGTVQAVVSINPAQRSWQATYTVPTLAARALDLSKAGFTVLDFLTSLPFPANIIPAGRVDPIAQSALDLMPIPTSSPTTGANATYTTSGTIPAGAQFAMPQQQSFGGFFNLLSSQQGPSTATYQLYVDNVLVASTTAQFTIQ